MRPLSQHALHAFRLTVTTGSISEAAKAIGRSQPAVTRLLQNLEAELGFPLFNRIKNRLIPTSTSLIFFDEVQRNFQHLDSLRVFAKDLAQGRERGISLGTINSLSTSIIPGIMLEYHDLNPDSRLTLQTSRSLTIAQKVQQHNLDVGLVASRDLLPGVNVLRQYRLPAVCISSDENHFAGLTHVSPEKLMDFPLVLPIPETVTGSQIDYAFHSRGLSPNVVARCQLTQVISMLVAKGMGVGIVDGWTASSHRALGGKVLPFVPELQFEIALIINSNARKSPQIMSLIEICDRMYEHEAQLTGD
ncbi:LysR substrate-binding domain-containing protein [Brucellaceae bacterium C25G]